MSSAGFNDDDRAPFTDLLALSALSDGRYEAFIDPIWTIGPKVHGGSLLAVLAAAARRRLADGAGVAMQPLAVSADFLAAPDPETIVVTTDIRKTGRQVSMVVVEASQHDRVVARAAVTLGRLDDEPPLQQADSLVAHPVEPLPDASVYSPDSPQGKLVHVAQGCHLALDSTTGSFLRGETGEPSFQLWARPFERDEKDPDTALLFALMVADISPPVLFNLGEVGWAPTVQMTAYLRRIPAPGWLRIRSSTESIGVASFDEDHVVVDATGAVVAQSRQLALRARKK